MAIAKDVAKADEGLRVPVGEHRGVAISVNSYGKFLFQVSPRHHERGETSLIEARKTIDNLLKREEKVKRKRPRVPCLVVFRTDPRHDSGEAPSFGLFSAIFEGIAMNGGDLRLRDAATKKTMKSSGVETVFGIDEREAADRFVAILAAEAAVRHQARQRLRSMGSLSSGSVSLWEKQRGWEWSGRGWNSREASVSKEEAVERLEANLAATLQGKPEPFPFPVPAEDGEAKSEEE